MAARNFQHPGYISSITLEQEHIDKITNKFPLDISLRAKLDFDLYAFKGK